MQTSVAGSPSNPSVSYTAQRSAGFTLLELVVVVAIIAIASVGVGFAMRDSSMSLLEREAERLSALLEAARAHSRITGLPVRWLADADGFHFEGLSNSGVPQNWLDSNTSVAGSTVLALGPDPIIGAQGVTLVSRSAAGKSLRLATDGVRPFRLQPTAP